MSLTERINKIGTTLKDFSIIVTFARVKCKLYNITIGGSSNSSNANTSVHMKTERVISTIHSHDHILRLQIMLIYAKNVNILQIE